MLHGRYQARNRFAVQSHARTGEALATGDAVAHYPATEGISSTEILTLVREASAALGDVVEALPAALRAGEALPARADALAAMHFPRDGEDSRSGRVRFAFEELLLAQLLFLRRRDLRRARAQATPLSEANAVSARWLEHGLPFALTGDQGARALLAAACTRSP